jgi:hypothetical protein
MRCEKVYISSGDFVVIRFQQLHLITRKCRSDTKTDGTYRMVLISGDVLNKLQFISRRDQNVCKLRKIFVF